MSRSFLAVLFVGRSFCAPAIDPGPARAVEAAAPVAVVVEAIPDAGFATFEVDVAVGSAHDPVGAEGIAALTARCTVTGGAGSRDAADVSAVWSDLGTSFDVTVDREATRLTLSCPAARALDCATYVGDVVAAPRFDAGVVAAQRAEAVDRVKREIPDEPGRLADLALTDAIFAAHPYGHPPDGRHGVLPLLDADDLRAFHRRTWVRANLRVTARGAIGDDAVAALRTALAPVPGVMGPDLALQRPLRTGGVSLWAIGADHGPTAVRIGHDVAVDPTDDAAVGVALAIFATRVSGRATWTPPLPRRQRHFSVGFDADSVEDAVIRSEWLVDALRTFVRDGVTTAEAAGAPGAPAIGVERLNDVIRRHLDPDRLWLVAVTPDPATFEAALVAPAEAAPGSGVGVSRSRARRTSAHDLFR
jgi:hypothetical protein